MENNYKPVSLRDDFSYREIETFGQMMLWLPNIADDPAAMDMGTADVVHQLVRVASEFEAEWMKLTDDEHEQLREDWLVEVEKLARWVKEHLYDVLHNELEYGMYRARRRVWGWECKRDNEDWGMTTYVTANRSEAEASMLQAATDMVKYARNTEGPASLVFSSNIEGCLCSDTANAMVTIGTKKLKYRLVSKWENK